ncbi:MAG: hypothetical protein HDT27_04170 [Subdoligranulum sp.]|nr:hypothetical protein [Subdoligranulum sp.]MBD5101888.1 hypothetical protein [Subdoligranulum sp.]
MIFIGNKAIHIILSLCIKYPVNKRREQIPRCGESKRRGGEFFHLHLLPGRSDPLHSVESESKLVAQDIEKGIDAQEQEIKIREAEADERNGWIEQKRSLAKR